ncbi:nicotinamidase-related amidase [Paraburkholderia sp. GAS448]|uniref:isochorismatase family cysteine hydrolase n=1 Tax=Paraburkholderia sp. GAS448 TaxID=3035136 RepID=UPI003D19B3DC
MTSLTYKPEETGLLIVDPYNDFMSQGGKLFSVIETIASEVGLIANLRTLMVTLRDAGAKIFFVPHHRWEPGDYIHWKFANNTQMASGKRQTFAKGTWGGEFHDDFKPLPGDIVIKEHWAQSGFANTDLDHQLKQYGIQKIIVVGLMANTCIESTARFGMELGYHVTLVKDGTAAASKDAMYAAHEVNGPTFAHAITTTRELLESFIKPG